MFSLDNIPDWLITAAKVVISRYLGMFSLDTMKHAAGYGVNRYFPLSWDVLIRYNLLGKEVFTEEVISRYLGMFSLDFMDI